MAVPGDMLWLCYLTQFAERCRRDGVGECTVRCCLDRSPVYGLRLRYLDRTVAYLTGRFGCGSRSGVTVLVNIDRCTRHYGMVSTVLLKEERCYQTCKDLLVRSCVCDCVCVCVCCRRSLDRRFTSDCSRSGPIYTLVSGGIYTKCSILKSKVFLIKPPY